MANEKYTEEEVKQKFEEAPAHIKEALTSNKLSNAIDAIAREYQLDEEQISELVDESGLLLLGLTPKDRFAENLEDRLLLEADVASTLARDVTSAIFENILEQRSSTPRSSSASNILYKDHTWCVTPTTLQQGATTYPIRTIASVSAPLREPFEFFGGFLLNGALFLFGLWCISHFTTGWVIGGLIATAIGGFNVWGQLHRGFFVIIKFANREDIIVNKQSKEDINDFYLALRQALDT